MAAPLIRVKSRRSKGDRVITLKGRFVFINFKKVLLSPFRVKLFRDLLLALGLKLSVLSVNRSAFIRCIVFCLIKHSSFVCDGTCLLPSKASD